MDFHRDVFFLFIHNLDTLYRVCSRSKVKEFFYFAHSFTTFLIVPSSL